VIADFGAVCPECPACAPVAEGAVCLDPDAGFAASFLGAERGLLADVGGAARWVLRPALELADGVVELTGGLSGSESGMR
jgi:hypothetical protein